VRAIEFFSGIGGFSFATRRFSDLEICAAWDNSAHVVEVYNKNHLSPAKQKNLDVIKMGDIDALEADLWWMSPPCAPYTRRGKQKHLNDHRTKSFLRLIEMASQLRPKYLLLENVAGFEFSRARGVLKNRMQGYQFWDGVLCPRVLFGLPNRRKRYYAILSRIDKEGEKALEICAPKALEKKRCSSFLGAQNRILVPNEVLKKYEKAMLIVDENADDLSCFTGAYAKSWVFSGSYLRSERGVEIFAPEDVGRLLGFPEDFVWPAQTTLRQKYKYLGNSLSIPMIEFLISEVLID